jgi:uridine phosphorylase
VGIGITYGATMNVDVLRFFQILGARRVVQCGYFGGLQQHMRRADFMVPSQFIRHDGGSDAYLPREVAPAMSALLTEALLAKLAGHPVHRLPQLSIAGGIASETQQHIDDWSAAGYGGVDLEFASTAAVCHRYGMAFTGLLLCSDVPVANESIFGPFEGEARRIYEERRQLMFKTAVELVAAE